MDKLKKEMGKRLAEIRKAKKIKQEELRELIGAPTVQMISNWENGHSYPSAHYLIILAKKLDISLDYLLLGRDNDTNNRKIITYKDAIEFMVALENCGLFKCDILSQTICSKYVNLSSFDKTILNFKIEYDNLSIASNSMREELFNQAVVDLLNKYDVPLKKSKD